MRIDQNDAFPVFKSPNLAALLNAVFLDNDEAKSLSQLADALNMPVASVHRYVGELEDAGLARSQQKGRQRTVHPDYGHPTAIPLMSLLYAVREQALPTSPVRKTFLGRVLREMAVTQRDAVFTLASGQTSRFYVDVKKALCHHQVLLAVAENITEMVRSQGLSFTHVGGLTMGADAVAVGVSLASGKPWFSVRKEPKARGHSRLIEGADLDGESHVLLVDDVVSTGGSTLKALDAVEAVGGTAIAAAPVVSRSANAASAFAARGVRYLPLLNAADLGIPELGAE